MGCAVVSRKVLREEAEQGLRGGDSLASPRSCQPEPAGSRLPGRICCTRSSCNGRMEPGPETCGCASPWDTPALLPGVARGRQVLRAYAMAKSGLIIWFSGPSFSRAHTSAFGRALYWPSGTIVPRGFAVQGCWNSKWQLLLTQRPNSSNCGDRWKMWCEVTGYSELTICFRVGVTGTHQTQLLRWSLVKRMGYFSSYTYWWYFLQYKYQSPFRYPLAPIYQSDSQPASKPLNPMIKLAAIDTPFKVIWLSLQV